MPLLALALFAVYLLIAFVARSVIQHRRTGDTGLRFGTERRWSAQWWARLAFVAALVAGGAAPALAAADWHDPIALLDHRWIAMAGAVVAIAGITATFVAQLAMGAQWRVGVDTGEATELVVTGPFTLARNPIFTAMATTAVGLVLVVPSVLALAGLAVLVWALSYQVRAVEEPYLRALHGDAYARYAARVGRFVPRLGRLPDAPNPPRRQA
ncbi:MAG TPA: isoprenylcysteine carboxylmethyltransferase family protein [Ilumatobacter sp.]|nr:isoprenylcysteine carboxylmethyltransferase family protein [Ilumatobacter sp.]